MNRITQEIENLIDNDPNKKRLHLFSFVRYGIHNVHALASVYASIYSSDMRVLIRIIQQYRPVACSEMKYTLNMITKHKKLESESYYFIDHLLTYFSKQYESDNIDVFVLCDLIHDIKSQHDIGYIASHKMTPYNLLQYCKALKEGSHTQYYENVVITIVLILHIKTNEIKRFDKIKDRIMLLLMTNPYY